MAKKDDWEFHVSALVKELNEGKAAIYSALKELIEKRYCVRVQKKDPKGRFNSVEYIIYEFPFTDEDEKILEETLGEGVKKSLPRSDFQLTDNQQAENRPQTNTYSKRIKTNKEHICSAAPRGDENAPFSEEKDEFGHEQEPFKLWGITLQQYKGLSNAQKEAYKLLKNVPAPKVGGYRYNSSEAVKDAKIYGLQKTRKAIKVYKQRIERGFKPKTLGALKEILRNGYEPEPDHAHENRKTWDEIKRDVSSKDYEQNTHEIIFTYYPYKEIPFSLPESEFKRRLEEALMSQNSEAL